MPLDLTPADEAKQRAELGGYTDAEFEREFLRSQRSDWLSICIRVLMLLVVYGLLARAIVKHDPPPWLLVLPLAFELLLIMVVGWLMSRLLIDCSAFRKSAGSLPLLLVWIALLIGGMALLIVFNPGGGGRAATPSLALAEVWPWLLRTDLHWALLAGAAGLLGATVPEVMAWQRKRGVFVWTSIMTAGFRIGVMFLLGFLGFFVIAFTGGGALSMLERLLVGVPGRALVWAVFGFLLLVEVLTLVITTLMHREGIDKTGKSPARARSR